MSNHIICFSPSGATLGQRILAVEDVFAADWELTQCFGADHESLSDWTKRVFQPGNNLLFIGAAGIAVRAIARTAIPAAPIKIRLFPGAKTRFVQSDRLS